MPKIKTNTKKAEPVEKDPETKEIILDDEEKVLDPEVVIGDVVTDDTEDEEGMDDDELDPFKDKWEE